MHQVVLKQLCLPVAQRPDCVCQRLLVETGKGFGFVPQDLTNPTVDRKQIRLCFLQELLAATPLGVVEVVVKIQRGVWYGLDGPTEGAGEPTDRGESSSGLAASAGAGAIASLPAHRRPVPFPDAFR